MDIAFIPLFALALYAGAELSRRPGQGGWIAAPLCVWLGEISYGLYMVHYEVMTLILWTAFLTVPHARYLGLLPVLVPAAVAVMLAAAGILHHALEIPARRAINRRFARHTHGRAQV